MKNMKTQQSDFIFALSVTLALLLFVTYCEFRYEVQSSPVVVKLYKDTFLSKRVVRFVHDSLKFRCGIRAEEIDIKSSYKNRQDYEVLYSVELEFLGHQKNGLLMLTEHDLGALDLQALECPGKDNKWVSFHKQANENHRSIASQN